MDFAICCDIENAIILWRFNTVDRVGLYHYDEMLEDDINKVNIFRIIDNTEEKLLANIKETIYNKIL